MHFETLEQDEKMIVEVAMRDIVQSLTDADVNRLREILSMLWIESREIEKQNCIEIMKELGMR